MRWSHYPLSAFAGAIRTLTGWACVIAATVLAGAWAGIWIKRGELPELTTAMTAVSLVLLSSFFHPLSAIAVAVAVLAYYLPVRCESVRMGVAAACLTFLTWLFIVALATQTNTEFRLW